MMINKLRRLLFKIIRLSIQTPRVILYKIVSDNKPLLDNANRRQPVLLTGKGQITLFKCNLGVWPSPSFFSNYIHIEARNPSASVIIEDGVWINNNACIIADRSTVTIKQNTLIGPNLTIFDSDFHGIHPSKRLSSEYDTKPVVIEPNVFIGANVTVLKGVTIGKGSIIGSGSLVTKSIPPFVIASGVPARVIKEIEV